MVSHWFACLFQKIILIKQYLTSTPDSLEMSKSIWMFPKRGVYNPSIFVWDLKWNKPSSYLGTPMVSWQSWHWGSAPASGQRRSSACGDCWSGHVPGEGGRMWWGIWRVPKWPFVMCDNNLESTAIGFWPAHIYFKRHSSGVRIFCRILGYSWMVNPRSLDVPSSDPVYQQPEKNQ